MDMSYDTWATRLTRVWQYWYWTLNDWKKQCGPTNCISNWNNSFVTKIPWNHVSRLSRWTLPSGKGSIMVWVCLAGNHRGHQYVYKLIWLVNSKKTFLTTYNCSCLELTLIHCAGSNRTIYTSSHELGHHIMVAGALTWTGSFAIFPEVPRS